MERIALHTRIAEGREADYDREHARIPGELDASLRAAGVHAWRIWRDGRDLFHLVEVEDYSAMRRLLAADPANQRWQEHINQFLEVVDDYGGEDRGIRPVWELPVQPAVGGAPPLELPRLGFGAAQLGNLYRVTTEEEADGAVRAAWEEGIRYFDTAPHYGLGTSERRLGKLLAAHPREDYLLSTKVGRLLRPGPGTGDDLASGFAVPDDLVREWDFTAAGVRRSHAESLERLGLDRVDILFAHDPEEGPTEQAFAEGLPALAAMREEGLVRAVGVGSKDAEVLTRAVRTGLIDLVMLSGRYTLLEQDGAAELLEACLRHDVGIVAVSVFNSGLLARHRVPDDATYEYAQAPAGMIDRARELAGIAERHRVTLPDLAVQFPLRHPAVRSVVLGMRTAAQVCSNAERMSTEIPGPAWESAERAEPGAASVEVASAGARSDAAAEGDVDDAR